MKTENIQEKIENLVAENPEFQAYFEMVARMLGCEVNEIQSISGIQQETIYEQYIPPVESVKRITFPTGEVFICHQIDGELEVLCKK